jgi:urease accessory protein
VSGWLATLDLCFEHNEKDTRRRTVLSRRRHFGPLMVQRPFYEDNGTCQVYVLHPPGGVVGGDDLSLACTLEPGARVLLTTPAATKFYRSAGPTAWQRQSFRVAPGANLEWLPQESILYENCRVRSDLRVELAAGAQFTGWEISCLGYNDRGFGDGDYVQRWSVYRERHILWGERSGIAGRSPIVRAPWGLAGRPVVGTLVSTGADQAALERVQSSVGARAPDWFSVTRLREILVCRYLGYSAQTAKQLFVEAWALLRPATSGREAVLPRVWAT